MGALLTDFHIEYTDLSLSICRENKFQKSFYGIPYIDETTTIIIVTPLKVFPDEGFHFPCKKVAKADDEIRIASMEILKEESATVLNSKLCELLVSLLVHTQKWFLLMLYLFHS